jgi:hypothetical protein
MGLFYTSSQPALPTVRKAIEDALMVEPANLPDAGREASDRTLKLAQTIEPKFNGFRFAIALLLSAALLGAAIWTGQHGLPDISKDLMNSFAGFSGIVLGMLGGEAQKSPSS